MWRNWKIHTLLVGMKKGAATVENSLAVSQKVKCKISLIYSAIPLLGIHPKELKTDIQTKLVHKSSQQHYSQWSKGNNPDSQLMNG